MLLRLASQVLEAIANVAKELDEAQAQLEAELLRSPTGTPSSFFGSLDEGLTKSLHDGGGVNLHWGHFSKMDNLRDVAKRAEEGGWVERNSNRAIPMCRE